MFSTGGVPDTTDFLLLSGAMLVGKVVTRELVLRLVRLVGVRLTAQQAAGKRGAAQARQRGMFAAPGVATPTEAFAALEAGASVLKLFPAEVIGPAGLKAMASVLPAGTGLWPVGGITPQSLAPWVQAGATGFGIGSQLFKPGMALAEIERVARAFVTAWAATR